MLITSSNWVDTASIQDHTLEQDSTTTRAENTQEMQLYKKYVANSASAAYIEYDFGAQKIVDTVAVLDHNLAQSNGTVRVRLANVSDFSTTVYDSTAVAAWPTVEEFGFIAWGEFHWGGILSGTVAADYTISFFKVLSSAVQARYLRIDLANSVSATTKLQCGRVFAGPSYRPTNSMEFGWEIQWVDDSVITKSLAGNTFIDERPRYRRLSFTLPALGRGEVFHNLFNNVDRRRGVAKDIIVIPQETDETTFITEAIYGRMLDLNPIENRAPLYYERTVDIEEII
jgi:hypothetical protein